MIADSAQQMRRELHKIPELDFELPETLKYIKNKLSKLSCSVFSPSQSSLAAFFDAEKIETYAFRADMDALPIKENTQTEYTSVNDGKMHACGHDGHTAMLLSFAQYLDAHKSEMSRNALLLFQPAEETTGGAKAICQSGIFEKYGVKAVFGTHLWPGLQKGCWSTCAGGIMASACEVDVSFTGKSVHIAHAEQGADALEAAAEFLTSVYSQIQKTDIGEPLLLKFGKLNAGTVRNALANEAVLQGSLRALSCERRDNAREIIFNAAASAAKKTGTKTEIRISEGYLPVVNDEELTKRVTEKLGVKFGILGAAPSMTAEDFSFYGTLAPSVFFRLGVGGTAPLHSPDFDFDDSILNKASEFYAALLNL